MSLRDYRRPGGLAVDAAMPVATCTRNVPTIQMHMHMAD